MIAFSCSQCGMKLKVQDHFAGRQAKCPTCKQPLAVPLPSATVPSSPPHQIDGAESSLVKAGLNGGVTLDNDPAGRKPTAIAGQKPQRSISDALAQRQKSTQRYVVEGEIARGGMGAVLRAVDCDIRREVAVKYMLDDKDPKKKARFIEEAQINGQLEHPNIVPVYDLGIDAQQRPFIMMKMVKGRSLKDVLDQLRDHPKLAEKDFSLGRLLNILVNVCNALSFAHARNVVHRDLKPANIMLGDFGEVYVMDWGLAKVLNQPGAADQMAVPTQATASLSGRNSKVVTNRAPEADLTQEGSVLGTPVYMPPEQATGDLNAIDQRSDVYSLGAILYEMLTLHPPVSKEGGHLSVLMQVVQGEIQAPQQREPKRFRAGRIPTELAAVAMKALAKERENRYPTADALRRDIERFQEGRSVSAKEDTKREMLWKFVKRNKGFSAGAAAALLVLLCSSWFLFQAWREAAQNYTNYRNAQEDKARQAKQTVPALVQAIKMMMAEGLVDEAMIQAAAAVEADPDHADARLLKGQLLLAHRQFSAAEQELTRCLEVRANDAEARRLLDLCRTARPEDPATLFALAEELSRQKRYVLADRLTKAAQSLVNSREQVVAHYRKRIDAVWPGKSHGVKLDEVGQVNLTLDGLADTNLAPLKGMPINSLSLARCVELHDLTALAGMPLTDLKAVHCKKLADLSSLKGVKLATLDLYECGAIKDVSPLAGMPLTALRLDWTCRALEDFSPLKNLPLNSLDLNRAFRLQDLSPLQGLPLTSLAIRDCPVSDLTPLQGMKLAEIYFAPKNVTKGMNVLRQMKSLRMVRVSPNQEFPAEEFWKRYDAGEFK